MTEFIPTEEPAAGACCCCEPEAAVAVEPEPAYTPVVEEAPVVAPAVEPVVPEVAPVAPDPAPLAPEPAAVAPEPAPTTTVVVERNIPAEFSGLSANTSTEPVRTDYTPQEFIDIGREASLSVGPNALDPNPETRAMDEVFAGLLRADRPADPTVAPVMPLWGPMRYSNTLTMIQDM